jgi:hypothetical protein
MVCTSGTMSALEKEILQCDADFYELDVLYSLVSGRPALNRRTIRQPATRKRDPNPAIAATLRKALGDLDRRRAEWEAGISERLHGKITQVVSKEKIRLQLVQENARFATQQSTLMSRGGMLAAKFSNTDQWRGDVGEDGSIFLDKDGDSFEWVLNLLRGYPMPQSLTEQQMVSLQHDLQHFGLDAEQFDGGADGGADGAADAESWVLAPSPRGVLSEEALVFTKNRVAKHHKHFNCGVLGTAGWTQGVHKWTVVLRAKCSCLMIGVAPSTLNLTGRNYDNCGFYLYSANGALYGQGGTSRRSYSPSGGCSSDGTRISVRLDCDAHTLTFGVNGVWLPPAWIDLPAVELFPAFDVGQTGCCFAVDCEL